MNGLAFPKYTPYQQCIGRAISYFHSLLAGQIASPCTDSSDWVRWVERGDNELADELSKRACHTGVVLHWNFVEQLNSRHIFGVWDGAWDKRTGVAGTGALLWCSSVRPVEKLDGRMHLVASWSIRGQAKSAQESELLGFLFLPVLLHFHLKDSKLHLPSGGETWSADSWCKYCLDLLSEV